MTVTCGDTNAAIARDVNGKIASGNLWFSLCGINFADNFGEAKPKYCWIPRVSAQPALSRLALSWLALTGAYGWAVN